VCTSFPCEEDEEVACDTAANQARAMPEVHTHEHCNGKPRQGMFVAYSSSACVHGNKKGWRMSTPTEAGAPDGCMLDMRCDSSPCACSSLLYRLIRARRRERCQRTMQSESGKVHQNSPRSIAVVATAT
jgi:hypothetical protein